MVIIIEIYIIKQQQNKTNSFILICKKKIKKEVLLLLENYIRYSEIRMKQWSHKRGS